MFNRLLPEPSELVTVTLPRPMGVVFEYDKRESGVRVPACVVGFSAGVLHLCSSSACLLGESRQDATSIEVLVCPYAYAASPSLMCPAWAANASACCEPKSALHAWLSQQQQETVFHAFVIKGGQFDCSEGL